FHAETSNGSSDAASESADASQAAVGATGPKTSTNARISQLIALAPASSSCPTDTVKAAGTSCTDDGNVCTTDQCNGTVGCPACVHDAGNGGAVCRAAAGQCDVAETCDGAHTTCPADGFKAAGTSCGSSASSDCDQPDTCDGSGTCQPNHVADGTSCTDEGNVCTADVCSAGVCAHPAGHAGTVCRASAGLCDPVETCTGTSTTCPADAKRPEGTECRAAAGVCDVAETCDGSSDACPSDAFKSSSTVCRAAADECDAAETCTGSSATCPSD